MSQRERMLSILVGGLLIAAGIWWGLGKYQSATKRRSNEITRLQQNQDKLNEQRMQGEYANRQMGEYLIRSLPGNVEKARSQYQTWLLSILQKNDLSDRSVDPTSVRKIDDIYREFAFRIQGKTTQEKLVGLLHDFYAKDYLHRIRNMTVRPSRDKALLVEMTVDALALDAAAEDAPAPEQRSYRISDDLAEYKKSILNRNFFSPPNQPPRYQGGTQLKAIVGQSTTHSLVFKDKENHTLRYELLEPPIIGEEGETQVSIDERSGTLQVKSDKKEPIKLLVRVMDNGYPNRTLDQEITINVVDPPPPPAPEEPELAFDDAKQTVLTALVQGRQEWTAWMHVRTRGETLRLRVGDSFEIGTIKGKVTEVTDRFVKLEIDGQEYELRPSGKLAELVTQ